VHLVGGQRWLKYCLEGGVEWTLPELKPVTSSETALEYLPIMADLDSFLLESVELEDEEIIFHSGGNARKGRRSFILSQSVVHSAEHKGEIAAVLKQHGFHINLDELDVRSYINYTKSK